MLLSTGPQIREGARERAGPAVLDLAERLLVTFGDLSGVMGAGAERLGQIGGLGPTKTARLLAVGEMAKRLSACEPSTAAIVEPTGAYRLFAPLGFEEQEVVEVAFLDCRLGIIRKEQVFRGALDESTARPREILRAALRANAAAFLVAHNHPSQDPTPSESDRSFTHQLAAAADAVGIPLIDHLIVCRGGRYHSFAAKGDIDSEKVLSSAPLAL